MHNNHKFSAHFRGPFKLLCKFAYCIELPPLCSILHNVFHFSKLKIYIPDGGDGTSINIQPVLIDSEEQHQVKKIIAECSYGNCKQYLVLWDAYLAEHDLWCQNLSQHKHLMY